jgi:hypothetical protein
MAPAIAMTWDPPRYLQAKAISLRHPHGTQGKQRLMPVGAIATTQGHRPWKMSTDGQD